MPDDVRWFRSAAERLTDEEQRTGIATTVRFDRSTMLWRGEVEGMSGYVEGVTQHEAQQALLSLLMTAPTVDRASEADITKEDRP